MTIPLLCTSLTSASDSSVARQRVRGYGQLPLSFHENTGRAPGEVRFLSRGGGYTLYLKPAEATLRLYKNVREAATAKRSAAKRASTAAVTMRLIGADQSARMHGEDRLPGNVHDLRGNDPARWKSHVATFARVRCTEVYPGIDLVYYGNQRRLEFDFVVAPGADPNAISFEFLGADRVEFASGGRLIVHSAAGPLVQEAPFVYQANGQDRTPVASEYVRLADNRIGFKLGAYDRARPLVIDPVLSYSRILGGTHIDRAYAIDVDAQGNAYITGFVFSSDFATTPGALDRDLGPTPIDGQVGNVVGTDAFVAKISPDGTTVLYSTYLGGARSDVAWDIAVDAEGNAYVVGQTYSEDFPTTSGAFQTAPFASASPAVGEGFVSKLDPTGSRLIYSTYLGDADVPAPENSVGAVTGADAAYGIAIDELGNAYIVGETYSLGFPTTEDAFDVRLGPEPVEGQVGGIGGTADAFVCKLNPSGTDLVYSTFLGGILNDVARDVAIDADGNAYVTGKTRSSDFPTTAGAFQAATFVGALPLLGDAFVTKLDPTGSTLVYSTYLGDADVERQPDPRYGAVTGTEIGNGIAVDAAGNAYIVGTTYSPNFPTTAGAFDRTLDTLGVDGQYGDIASSDAFVTKLSPDGSTAIYSTYLGGDGIEYGLDIAVDADGNAYVVGSTSAFEDFPETPNAVGKQSFFNAFSTDAFLTILGPDGAGLVESVRFGGNHHDYANGVALGSDGTIYVAGSQQSNDFLGDLSNASGINTQAFVAAFRRGALVVDPPPCVPAPCGPICAMMMPLTFLGLCGGRLRLRA